MVSRQTPAAIHPFRKTARHAVNLSLALAIALALCLLNLAVNYIVEIHALLGGLSRFRITTIIVNALFLWLAAMLWLAFRRWRRAERDRAEIERAISAISPDVLLVVTPDREIVMCNSSVKRVFGYSEREVLRCKTDLLYGDRRSRPGESREIHDALDRQGFHVGLATGRRKDGAAVPLEIITGILSGRAGAVLLLRDITERVRAEEAARRLRERLARRQQMDSLGVLAGGVAHDFNNLLAGIMGNAELALQSVPASDVASRENLGEILQATRRAAQLCRDVLSSVGKGRPQTAPLDLSELVRGIAHVVEVTVSKRHRLRYELAADLPAVEGDAPQLRQAILNLTANATEAIGAEDGTITVSTGARDCDAAYLATASADEPPAPGRYVYVCVADSGPGMDAAARSHLFEPFFTTKRGKQGLGLVGVRGIAEGHRGAVAVETGPGKGAAVTVLLPAAPRPAPSPAAGPAPENARRASGGAAEWKGGGTVLLIEDEPTILQFVEPALKAAGFEVLIATDGYEGVSRFREHRDEVSLTLLDLTMPRMSGAATLREIRALDPKARVILCSGADFSSLPSELRSERILQKPYHVDALLAKVREAVGGAA
jgi:PAS domain S-box-containing protein